MRGPDSNAIENTQKTPDKEKSAQTVYDWKVVLDKGLGDDKNVIYQEKAWAQLCSKMREACPETNWYAISERVEKCTPDRAVTIDAIGKWLNNLLASSEWPFPEKIILVSVQRPTPSWKIIFEGNYKKLPFTNPPLSLSVIPFRDKFSSGWTIHEIDSYNISKVGEA